MNFADMNSCNARKGYSAPSTLLQRRCIKGSSLCKPRVQARHACGGMRGVGPWEFAPVHAYSPGLRSQRDPVPFPLGVLSCRASHAALSLSPWLPGGPTLMLRSAHLPAWKSLTRPKLQVPGCRWFPRRTAPSAFSSAAHAHGLKEVGARCRA